MVDPYMKFACMIACPSCDEEKCVGRDICSEIKSLIEEMKVRDDHATD